jgi:hypothetical protein
MVMWVKKKKKNEMHITVIAEQPKKKQKPKSLELQRTLQKLTTKKRNVT